MTDKLSPGGQILFAIATALGARVTSTFRDEKTNATVGGSPASKHLSGDAIDLGHEAPQIAVNALSLFGVGGWHDKGTAPHYHFEATAYTVPLFIAGILAAGMIARHGKVGK